MMVAAVATGVARAEQPVAGPLLQPLSQERLNSAATNKNDFLLAHGNYKQTRYHLADQINRSNVKNLKLAWSFATGVKEGMQASPIVFDGVMLLSTSYNHVLAVDARSGKLLWRYQHKFSPTIQICCGPVNRGVEVLDGLVYLATLDAQLVALDLKTGALVWQKQIDNPLNAYGATAAPLVVDGKVIIGVVGGEYGIRGKLRAFDAKTGNDLWTFYTTPENSVGVWAETDARGVKLNRDIAKEKALYAKIGDPYKTSGGPIWHSPAVDLKTRRLYFAVGNAAPDLDDSTRPGDNLYTASMVSIDLDTGKYVCHLQYVPHDIWDYDSASAVILTDVLGKNGEQIPGVVLGQKTGYIYVHDARDCSLLRTAEASSHINMYAIPTAEGVQIRPGNNGGITAPMAIDPKSHLAYTVTVEKTVRYYKTPHREYVVGKPDHGGVMKADQGEIAWGELVAANYDTGAIKWRVKKPTPMYAGPLATAGGLVFTGGTGDGEFGAYNSDTGEQLWSYKDKAGVDGFVSTYMLDGKQYVVVGAGGNSVLGHPRGDSFLVFALDDNAKN